jgi:hypothetical protein
MSWAALDALLHLQSSIGAASSAPNPTANAGAFTFGQVTP